MSTMNREQAIAWLRSVGHNAAARDWSLGATIAITVGEARVADGISVYPGMLYLYPAESGGWNLLDLSLPDPAMRFADLESAVHGAHEYVARKEATLR